MIQIIQIRGGILQDQKTDLFIRIKQHFKSLIDKGAYLEGEGLPSVRKAAESLGVNPNTVQKAFQLLVEDNYIEILPKKGAYVIKQKNSTDLLLNSLKQALDNYLKTHSKKETLETLIHLMEESIHD